MGKIWRSRCSWNCPFSLVTLSLSGSAHFYCDPWKLGSSWSPCQLIFRSVNCSLVNPYWSVEHVFSFPYMSIKQLVLKISEKGKARDKIICQLYFKLTWQASFKCAYPSSFPWYIIPYEGEKLDVNGHSRIFKVLSCNKFRLLLILEYWFEARHSTSI